MAVVNQILKKNSHIMAHVNDNVCQIKVSTSGSFAEAKMHFLFTAFY